ncbi:RNA polymerase sigma factor [Actinomadura roseirufa]|uniref:RNA polymerase sigma factor n=1 Tax=Actinomadura roseirufa TaxID=2094049 RepID=UPI001A95522F|nr:sigma-70 family RNA polymerase sigma factor [Actinomadura roseirufa]
MSGWPSLDRADDERLARTLAGGDPGALIQVMDRYAARLYDYCHALLRDQESAAGALHDALIAAYAHISVLREPGRFRGWLYALVRAECMRRLHAPDRPAERYEAPEVEDGFLSEGELARRLEARRLVHGALAGLRGRERETLDLMLRHGLDAGEIGGVLGLDAQEAAALATEARARLDDALAAAFVARTGRADCAELAALAGDGGDAPLAPQDVHRIVRHIDLCAICHARAERVAAARLLQVLPVAMMPTDLRGLVLATATDPALSADLAAIARRAEPFDSWGWPAPGGAVVPDEPDEARRPPRGLWPALAAAAAVILVVTGAFFLMPGSSGDKTGAQADPSGPASSAPDPSDSGTPADPSESPTPTPTSTPTPTPTLTTPTPTKTPTHRASPTPMRTPPTSAKPGGLVVQGCTIEKTGGCAIKVTAVGGPVTWSVTGRSANLSAAGGGTLAAGASQVVQATLLGECTPPGGSGTVYFSPRGAANVMITCPAQGDGGNGNGNGNGKPQ